MPKNTLPIDISDLSTLTPRQLVFIGEYCNNDYDAESAARVAKLVKPEDTPAQVKLKCHELLNTPDISTAISRFVESILAPYRDSFENVRLRELYVRAFYKPSWYHKANGEVIPLDKIPLDRQGAIDRVEEKFYGKDAVRTVTYTLANKDIARKELKELLAKPGEESPVSDSDMRSRLKEIFDAAKMGMKIGAKAVKEIQSEPSGLLERLKEGKADAVTVQ